jgi:[acyl-carrier-protein] S-malonyltransferase
MPEKLYILCPGQGAQVVGMGKTQLETSATARQTFETAGRVLGFDLAQLCLNGPQEQLNRTDISQPAIYVASVASYQDAVEKGKFEPESVVAYAGLSLGEYTALHLAGVFGFEEGLRIVQRRGQLMQEAATATPGGMVALIGADEESAARLCEQAAQGEVLVPANYNAPGQIVVSGTREACQRVTKAAEAEGFRATTLQVAGAFHSPLMAAAARKMETELARIEFRAPRKPVYSNVTAQPNREADAIKDLLVQQIVRPVRWAQTMAQLVGPEARFIELSPGRTLAGLARRIDRRAAVESLG